MRTLSILLLAAGLAQAASGHETDEQYTVNPDGSGKVTMAVVFPASGMTINGREISPAEQAQTKAKELLEESGGVAAWADVSFGADQGGRLHFRGTAYFQDISRLSFPDVATLRYRWKAQDGTGVLSLAAAESWRGAKPDKPLTEDEIKTKIEEQRRQYQQNKSQMTGMLDGTRMAARFKLPGTVEAAGFVKGAAAGEASLSVSAAQIQAATDQLMQDDALLHDLIAKGYNPADNWFSGGGWAQSAAQWLKMFAVKAAPRATVTALKPQFDYAAEVAAADKGYPAMVEKAGLAAALGLTPPELRMVTVTGVQIMWLDPNDLDDVNGPNQANQAKQVNQNHSYMLFLAGKLSSSVHGFEQCKIDKAVTDAGEDLIPENSQNFWVNQHHTNAAGEEVFTGQLYLTMPGEKSTMIRELSGKLCYTLVVRKRRVDLGLTEFKAGAKGTECGVEVVSVDKNGNFETLNLKVSNWPSEFGTIKLYDEDGVALDINGSGWSLGGNGGTMSFSRMGGFPAKGRIEVEVYDEVKHLEAPFKLENVPLIGKPVKPKA